MAVQIVRIILLALLGSATVPIAILILARAGYLPPLTVKYRERKWVFAPKMKIAQTQSNATVLSFPRQVVYAGAITAILTIQNVEMETETIDIVNISTLYAKTDASLFIYQASEGLVA